MHTVGEDCDLNRLRYRTGTLTATLFSSFRQDLDFAGDGTLAISSISMTFKGCLGKSTVQHAHVNHIENMKLICLSGVLPGFDVQQENLHRLIVSKRIPL